MPHFGSFKQHLYAKKENIDKPVYSSMDEALFKHELIELE